jgi:hypothetical protein
VLSQRYNTLSGALFICPYRRSFLENPVLVQQWLDRVAVIVTPTTSLGDISKIAVECAACVAPRKKPKLSDDEVVGLL